MDNDSFNQLALRVLAGEATADDRRALETELAATPARKEEFAQLKISHDVLRASAPLTEAAKATGPELPAWRVNELRTAVHQHFGPEHHHEAPGTLRRVVRWLFAGGSVAALGLFIAFISLANKTVAVGLYQTDAVRGDATTLAASDVPAAKVVTFAQDAPFDAWQTAPLAWNEHAKVWVDNEHDLLHIVYRDETGKTVLDSQPLAPTDAAQREQIKQVVGSLQK
jgi:hypothetical protein